MFQADKRQVVIHICISKGKRTAIHSKQECFVPCDTDLYENYLKCHGVTSPNAKMKHRDFCKTECANCSQ